MRQGIGTKNAFGIGITALSLLVLPGAYAAVVKFVSGEEIYGTTQLVPLGVLISTYIFFVVSSTGLSIITSLGHVFGIKRFELIGRRGVFLAIITLLCGFGSIGLELERPFRLMAYNFTSPQFTAPIWWMGLFYTLSLLFLICEFGLLLRKNSRAVRIFGTGVLLTKILATCTLGAIFGVLIGRPYWHGAYMPIYLLLSAVVSGTAFIICFTIVTYYVEGKGIPSSVRELILEMGRILGLFLGITILCIAWKLILSLFGQPLQEYQAVKALLSGPLSASFWIFEVLIGSLFPFVLLILPRTQTIKGIFVAALCVIVGMFASRYDLVVVGQIYPVWGGEYARYCPNHMEWFIVIACMAGCLLLYTLGDRFLPLKESDGES